MFLNFDTGRPVITRAPPTRAPMVLGIGMALYLVAIIFMSTQLLVKSKFGKLAVEDLLIFISSILLLALLVNTWISCEYGFGMHVADIKPEWILPYSKISFASVILAELCFAITKCAMLRLYLRFAISRRFRILCWLTIVYVACTATVVLLINLFGCTPLSGGWDSSPSNPSVCVTTTAFYIYSKGSNMLTDVVLLVLPFPILLRLRLEWLVKLGLVVMFSMGLLVAAVGGVSLWQVVFAVNSDDIIWDGAMGWMWALLELNVSIMATCMPGMKMFITWMWGEKKPLNNGEQQEDTIGGGAGRGRKQLRVRAIDMDSDLGALELVELRTDGSAV